MKLKKLLALLLAVAFLSTAVPFAAHAKKKRKDGPDEPKLTTVITEQGIGTR
jgi:hypothetical protein